MDRRPSPDLSSGRRVRFDLVQDSETSESDSEDSSEDTLLEYFDVATNRTCLVDPDADDLIPRYCVQSLASGATEIIIGSTSSEESSSDESAFPSPSFGKRNGLNYRRNNDCIVLQHSEMIVIDYPDVQHIPVQQSPTPTTKLKPRPPPPPAGFQHHQRHPSLGQPFGHHPQPLVPPVAPLHPPQHPPLHPPPFHHRYNHNDAMQQMRKSVQSLNLECSHAPSTSVPHEPPPPPPPTQPPPQMAFPHYDRVSLASSGGSSQSQSTIKRASTPKAINRYHEHPPPPLPPTSSSAVAARLGLPRTYNTDFTALASHDPMPSSSGLGGQAPSLGKPTIITGGGSHKSHVFLNGQENEDDVSCVRVRPRTEKSNSVGSVGRKFRVRSTASSSTTDGDELVGLPEQAMDSEDEDEESCPSHEGFNFLKDSVRECLEKDPSQRTSDDISTLLDFMQHMPALASFPMSIKRQLCLKMVFAVVSDAGTCVMEHGEKLDAWSVIVNGAVEVVKPNGERMEYKLGDSFGAEPTPTEQFHVGEMRTLVDDCEFVLVEHKHYCSIMSTISEHIEKESDGLTGEIVSETERRTVGNQVGLVLIKAKPEKLIQHLLEELDASVDAHYVDDFLLMYRVFLSDPKMVMQKLSLWFHAEPVHRDKVARIVLLWVNNHYNDFETDNEMLKLLEEFEQMLEREAMQSQQALLNIACSVKSRPRTITYTRPNREQGLSFSILGGKGGNYGIFISNVEKDSKAEHVGLKRGDEILEVNGQSFKQMNLMRSLELLRASTHIVITVKSNLLGFKEMLQQQDRDFDSVDGDCTPSAATIGKANGIAGKFAKKSANSPAARRQTLNAITALNGGGSGTLKGGMIAKSSMMDKLLTMIKGNTSQSSIDSFDDSQVVLQQRTSQMRSSRSNPDIASHVVKQQQAAQNSANIAQYYQPPRSFCPEHVLKVYRSDQSFKYLTVYKETNAQNVVQLALQEFGMTNENSSLEWALCETTVTPEGVIKQRRLPDHMQNLAERIALNSRYYLKNNNRSEPLVPDELAPEILKEAHIQLHHLNAHVVAAQLTLQDFAVFSSIEPTEYVDNLFKLESKYGWPKLTEFEELFNKEMWWVVTEICSERTMHKRAKLIKKFIKIARHCRDFRNFNSMFAIISGLENRAVCRLTNTWERVSGKYRKMFDDVKQLMDPTRNMSKYRQHLALVSQDPPVIPIYPFLCKDLFFSHNGNQTWCDNLVNFEKLRMIARNIRSVTKLASAPFEIGFLAQQSGSAAVNDALMHMNSFENASGAVATMRKVTGPGVKAQSQSRKKMYEQALMVRKVKAYLANLQVVESEAQQDQLSYECEPPPSQASVGSGTGGMRRRAPSPSPSSLSSQSNQSDQKRLGPKFGMESPQAVQKMLSLVQNSRVKPSTSAALSCSPAQSPHLTARSSNSSAKSSAGTSRPSVPSITRVPSIHSRNSTNSADVHPVDLSAESSSVTSAFYAPGVRINSSEVA
uniref:PDZ domain-containing protein n=1 Tax=Steinernema glaseri TaxID=37863 RepID=A0A1I7ZB16_9BILA